MADDLSLLFRLRADNAQAKATLADTRAAISQLHAATVTDFGALQNAGSKAFAGITDNLNAFVSQRVPLVGNAFVRLTGNLGNMGTASDKVEKQTAGLVKTIDGLASSTGKSSTQITSILTKFVQLGTQTERDTFAIKTFGATAAQNLIPQLEKAGTELSTVAANSTAAGAGIGALATPAGIAALAVAALAIGAGLLAKGLFDLAVAAAEFRGKLFDLSQQTGVSVETLSALEIVAKTTGGSIEGITASLGIFQKKLEESQDATSDAAKTLNELGVSNQNTEESLRQTLAALAKMPEGFHQTATALELFGRGGKQILAILKEMDGDLDGAIARFRELGLVISTEDAKAADEFNDQLAILQFQFRALLGQEVIPAALVALQTLSTLFKENRESINVMGQALGVLSNVVLAGFLLTLNEIVVNLERINQLTSVIGLPFLGGPKGASDDVGEFVSPGSSVPGSSVTPFTPKGKKDGADKARREAEARALKAVQVAQQALEDAVKGHHDRLERERDRDLKNIDDWERESLELAEQHEKDQQQLLDREEAIARRYTKGQEDLSLALITIQQKRNKALNVLLAERQAIEDEAQKRRDQSALTIGKQLAEIRDVAREGELARIKEQLGRQAITESDAITQQLVLLKDAYDQRLALIDEELKQESTSAARKTELDNERIKSEQRHTDEKKRLTRERIDALNNESAAGAPGVGTGITIPPIVVPDVGLPPPNQDKFDAWKDAFEELRNIGANAMQDLAFGVGSLVENWVLLGNIGPQAVRKMVASVLAGVAAQAAVKAIYELAEGFAALFRNPAEAAAHFTSAAIFGSIAGVAAVAGRVVAENAFQSESTGGGPGARSSTSNGGSATPTTIEVDRRNQSQGQRIEVVLKFTGGLQQVIEGHVVDNWRSNGRIRTVVQNDGQ